MERTQIRRPSGPVYCTASDGTPSLVGYTRRRGRGWNRDGRQVTDRVGVIYCGSCGAMNPRTNHFCSACGHQLVDAYHASEGLRVYLTPDPGAPLVEILDAEGADRVVIAGGSWANRLKAGGPQVRPIKGQLVRLRFDTPPATRVLWSEACYMVPWQDGTLRVWELPSGKELRRIGAITFRAG